MRALLRVCASCEWIFKLDSKFDRKECPWCGFAHYSARYVYGKDAYRFAKTQEPWKNKKLATYESKLDTQIKWMKDGLLRPVEFLGSRRS